MFILKFITSRIFAPYRNSNFSNKQFSSFLRKMQSTRNQDAYLSLYENSASQLSGKQLVDFVVWSFRDGRESLGARAIDDHYGKLSSENLRDLILALLKMSRNASAERCLSAHADRISSEHLATIEHTAGKMGWQNTVTRALRARNELRPSTPP